MNQAYSRDPMADPNEVSEQCTGIMYKVLNKNYELGIKRVKDILIGLIRAKFAPLHGDFQDEVNFIVDTVKQFIKSDYKLAQSM